MASHGFLAIARLSCSVNCRLFSQYCRRAIVLYLVWNIDVNKQMTNTSICWTFSVYFLLFLSIVSDYRVCQKTAPLTLLGDVSEKRWPKTVKFGTALDASFFQYFC